MLPLALTVALTVASPTDNAGRCDAIAGLLGALGERIVVRLVTTGEATLDEIERTTIERIILDGLLTPAEEHDLLRLIAAHHSANCEDAS